MSSLQLGTHLLPVTTFPSLPPINVKLEITRSLTSHTYAVRVRHRGSQLSLPHGAHLHLKLLPLSLAQNELLVYCHLKSLQGKIVPKCYGLVHFEQQQEGGRGPIGGILLEPLWGYEIENRYPPPSLLDPVCLRQIRNLTLG